tara:strand:+ start:5715 stop:5942 length:228 start_codon:yes stop_codon:yes gene_type:complete
MMSIFDLILTLFQFVVYGTCGMCLSYLIFAVIYDVYILNIKPYFTHNREMTPRKKKLKQTLMDHYLYEKEGYKSD